MEPEELPPVAEMIEDLHRAGWSIGDVAYDAPRGRVWIVSVHERRESDRGGGEDGAGGLGGACEQARAVGML